MTPATVAGIFRDPLAQPFSQDSIWNVPLGSGAVYRSADIKVPAGVSADEDIIILTPSAPLTGVYENFAGWSARARTGGRCGVEGALLATVPIPSDYVFNSPGQTPNAGVAILKRDGRSVHQSQPFSRCTAGEAATSQYVVGDEDIYGAGIAGAHGGSHLSTLGGTIRVGELAPGSTIRHVLKINLDAVTNLAYDAASRGFRWPATAADSYASTYRGTNPALVMGSLLALAPTFDVRSLQTEPARIIARALIDYGAYVVDDSAYDGLDFDVETGPAGSVYAEVLRTYGFEMFQADNASPWLHDVRTIATALQVIDNNTATNIGGGGVRRQPPAPPFAPVAPKL